MNVFILYFHADFYALVVRRDVLFSRKRFHYAFIIFYVNFYCVLRCTIFIIKYK